MSACAPTDRLLQTLRITAPGAPDGVIELQLFNVIDEFLRRTSAWQMNYPFELIEGQMEYAFPTPPNAVVVRVMWVSHNEVPVPTTQGTAVVQSSLGVLDPSQVFSDGDAEIPWDVRSDSGETNLFTWAIYRPDYITVTGAPDVQMRQYPLITQIALSLARGCLECDCGDWDIPEWMWDMYFQEWLDGTQGRLFGMASKPWTNVQLAQYHAKRFRNQMAYRKQEVPKGFTWDKPVWRFPGNWTR